MSKQSEAKAQQNYRKTPNHCGNCRNYESQHVEKTYEGYSGKQVWTEEKGKRCTIGGFAVQKMGVCDRHELAPNAKVSGCPLGNDK